MIKFFNLERLIFDSSYNLQEAYRIISKNVHPDVTGSIDDLYQKELNLEYEEMKIIQKYSPLIRSIIEVRNNIDNAKKVLPTYQDVKVSQNNSQEFALQLLNGFKDIAGEIRQISQNLNNKPQHKTITKPRKPRTI